MKKNISIEWQKWKSYPNLYNSAQSAILQAYEVVISDIEGFEKTMRYTQYLEDLFNEFN